MYMAGRLRTASKPSRTLIELESYTSGGVRTSFDIVLISFVWHGSDAHWHDHVPVLLVHCVVSCQDGLQFARTLLIFQGKGNLLLRNGPQELQKILCVESDFEIRASVLAGNA